MTASRTYVPCVLERTIGNSLHFTSERNNNLTMLPRFDLSVWVFLLACWSPLVHCIPFPADGPSPPPQYLRCNDNPDPSPPSMTDCLFLTRYITAVSRRPGQNNVRRWGESQLERPAGRTAHLPKRYFIGEMEPPRTGPGSCLLYLDDSPREGLPTYDEFKLSDVAHVGERINIRCLINENRGGIDYPGKYGTVYVKLTRYTPLTNDASLPANATALFTQVEGNRTLTLYEATGSDQPENILGAQASQVPTS